VDEQYLLNMKQIQTDEDKSMKEAIYMDRIACGDARNPKENMDPEFGYMWQHVLHGGMSAMSREELIAKS
jgi:hypothetical protein